MLYQLRKGSHPQLEPLLLLHGFMGSPVDWEPLIEHLPSSTPVYAALLPGHTHPNGSTTPLCEPLTLDTVATLLVEEILSAIGQPVTLVGYSLGGRVALHLACKQATLAAAPFLRHLVVISAHPGMQDLEQRIARAQHDRELAAKLLAGPFSSFLTEWYQQPIFASLCSHPHLRDNLIATRQQQKPALLAPVLERLSTGVTEPLWLALRDLKIPTTYIAGGLDPKYCDLLRTAHVATPQSRFEVVREAGHAPHLETPQPLATILTQTCGMA